VAGLLLRLHTVGILEQIHPSLGKTLDILEHAVDLKIDHRIDEQFWVGLLSYNMTSETIEEIIERFGFPARCRKFVRDLVSLREVLPHIDNSHISSVEIYDILQSYSPKAIDVCIAAENEGDSLENIIWFQSIFHSIKPLLNGKDLLLLGIAEGPKVGEVLNLIRRAKVLGQLRSRSDEVDFVRDFVTG
jgi:tRNA nucleotidyltransferase (CCA-adding enzyme)